MCLTAAQVTGGGGMSGSRGFVAWDSEMLLNCMVLIPNHVSATDDRYVRVIITPAQAVPVAVQGTPSVSLAGTPTVNVGNSPTVSISGTPTVQVEGREPWQVTDRDGTGSASPSALSEEFPVPAGKDLVVTF